MSEASLEYSLPWSARSNRALYFVLCKEAEIYSEFSFLSQQFQLGNVNFRVNLNQFLPDKADRESRADDFSSSEVRDFLPNTSSAEGQLLLRLCRSGKQEKARDLVYAFFVENAWTANPLEGQPIQNRKFASQEAVLSYIRGISLLGGARGFLVDPKLDAEWSGFQEAVSSVRSEAAQAKSRITRVKNLFLKVFSRGKKIVAGMGNDRKQVRRMAGRGFRIAHARFERDRLRWNKNFSEVHDQFTKQLEYKAPVELWKERAEFHRESAAQTRRWLIGSGVVFLLLIAVVVLGFGDEIASTFILKECDEDGSGCSSAWSAKGPLTISAILLATSLILWFLRTLNKFYLSATHLASDAEEKKAFVQTFLALREDDAIDEQHEAIILTALFRPTQDGVVADESAPLDPSLVSMVSRRLSS